VLLALVIVLPWMIAIALESHGAFFQQSLGNDFAAKVAGGQEGHFAPPGYFLILAAASFWPAILFVLPGIGVGIARRGEPEIRFLLAWAGAWWLVVEAVPTKLPQYILPSYPALAILAALWLLAPAGQGRRWLSWIAGVQFLLGLGLLVAAPLVLPRLYGTGTTPWLIGAAGAVALIGLAALILFALGKRLLALLPLVAASLLAVPLLTAGVAPGLTQLWVSQNLAALVARDRGLNDPPPVLAGYTEPSLVFALGADVGLADGRGAAEWGASQGGLALIEDSERPQFLARLAELQADATQKDELSGFNYSRGRPVHVTVYRVTGLHDAPAPSPP
jgi:4-amino-4-deoxy-L-arabinose transferase-like glycosyltransferase